MNLLLEFDAPLRLFGGSHRSAAVHRSLLRAADASSVASSWERWGCSRAHLPALRTLLDLPEGMPKDVYKHLRNVWVCGRKLDIKRAL